MRTLHIIVSNKQAIFSRREGGVVCGNADYQIEFHFDAEWSAYETKTARFIWNGKYKDVVFTGAICPVPIVANTDRLEVGVYAEDLSTTTSAVITCEKSIRCNTNLKSEGTVVIPSGGGSANVEAWSPETTAYNPGDIVLYNGNFYICTQELSVGSVMNIPGVEGMGWEPFNGIYRGEWNAETTYKAGDVVSHNGSVYMSLNTNTASEPYMLGRGVYWDCLNTYTYVEDFTTYPTYQAGAIVKYKGSVYLCTKATNMLYYPDEYPDYWEKLNDGTTGRDIVSVSIREV